ncbi:hypothetical protein VTN77DRAFT_3623 [Rasamsonia byssochlamydoides]|uniref:uncharacterized protein n=1 Tax=Rasamsonia byssochlamydoides TaxID=89139 RepID=UPI00374405C6
MVHFSKLAGLVAGMACLATQTIAHPGEIHDAAHLQREIQARNVMAAAAKRSLNACADSVEARSLHARNIARRAKVARELRQKRGITGKAQKFRRDLETLETYEAIDHNRTGILQYTPDTPETTVFAANTSCILTPEVTDGPYYVWGELIRKNVKEAQYSDGIDLYLEVQYLDINTCKPVPNVYVDIWNCNATGVYSGISESGNYAADGWNSTYLRGIQPTDEDGVASFETIFPGHYEGRATHTHLLAHTNVTINTNNNTLARGTGSVTHIGQLFWNEALRSAVEATYPYNTNTQPITSNADDMWSIVQAANDYDPFPEFLYLGEDVTDGLMAWIQIGINVTADYTDDSYYNIAAYYEADGGHQNTDSSFGGGSGGNSTGPGPVPSATPSA